MSNAVRYADPHPAVLEVLASIPLIESHYATRGSLLHVKRDAFMDAPTVPAVVMHPIDYQVMQVAVETGTSMRDVGTQLEGARRYVVGLIEKRAARAIRRIERTANYRPVAGEQDA